MSLQRLVINTGDLTAAGFKSVCDLAPGQLPALQNLENYLGAVLGGNQSALLSINVGAVQASATFTVSAGGSLNTQAGTLLNETFTAVTSGAVPADGEFNISATAATQAASMVTAINTVLAGVVLASADSGVVTIVSLVPGLVGNGLEISAGNLANVVAAAFADGEDGTAYEIDLL